MQNVVNLLSTFFDNDGNPAVAGRVHFCKVDTSAKESKGIESPDYIVIKDKDGKRLKNPLPLDDRGVFSNQPFVDDGVDYKVYVDVPTGVPAEFEDDSMCWETVLVYCSYDRKIQVEYSGIGCVDNISELRQVDPARKCVMVLGYDDAEDECCARIFKWVYVNYSENYGTHIKFTEAPLMGTWICEPEGFIDVRWFGIKTDSGNDVSSYLISISQEYPNIPIYFPAGRYNIGLNVTINSAILDKNAFFYPIDQNVIMKIGHLENRGGTFNTVNGNRVIPCFPGVLHTSVLNGTTNEYLTAQCLEKLDEIYFDSYNKGSSEVTISGKKVFVKNGITLQNIKFDNCVVFYESTASMTGFKEIFFYQTGASVRLSLNGIEINVGSSTAKFAYNGMTVYGKAEMLGIESGRNSNSKVYINSGKDGIYVLDLLHTEDVEFEASITYNNVQADNCKFVNAELRNLKFENVVVGTESIQVLDGTESSDFPAILDQTAEFGKKVVLINRNMQQDIAFRYYTYNEETRTMTIPTGSAVELMCVDVKTSSSPNLWVAFFGRSIG